MPAVFPPCCRSSSAKCFYSEITFLVRHSDNTDIFLNQLIQFYSNNATDLRHLTIRTVRRCWK